MPQISLFLSQLYDAAVQIHRGVTQQDTDHYCTDHTRSRETECLRSLLTQLLSSCSHASLHSATPCAGTYELTNFSVISSWRWAIVLADTAWGSLSCGLSCVTMFLLQSALVSRRA